jgi:hypothetical protein
MPLVMLFFCRANFTCSKGSTMEEKKDIAKETLKPITKVKTDLDRELQEWEVQSTKGGQNQQDS